MRTPPPTLLSRLPARLGRRGSIRTQLIAWNIVALTVLLGVLGGVIRYTVFSFMRDSVDRELETQLNRLLDRPPPRNGFSPQDRRPPRPPDGRDFREPGRPPRDRPPHDISRPQMFDLQGRPFPMTDRAAPWDIQTFALAKAGETHRSIITVENEPYRVLSAPVLDRGRVVAIAQNAYPLSDVYLALAGLNRALLTLIPVGLLCAGWGGAYLTDRVLRRVRRMTQAAGHIGAQDFSERLPVMGNDEFSELSETFNGLLGRLESAYKQQESLLEQQRRFTADASHELKTPLTIIKGTTSMTLSGHPSEETYRQSLQEIDKAAGTMSHLVQDLLLLARSDGGQLGRQRTELLLSEILERAISGVAAGGAPITRNIEDETLTVMGNESELVRLFSNLLDNALRYTPADGKITVTACREGAGVVVRVADTGSGIAPEHLPHLGERFYRVDTSRSRPSGGTGLGLSICKGIVEAHGGLLSFASRPGVGTTVSVTFEAPPVS